jgi:hypothetical protein
MKKLIIMLLILLSANTLCFAQTWQVRPLWEIDNRFKNPELQDTLWINEQKRFFIGGHWLAASKHVLRMLNTTFYHNHDFRWDDSLHNSPLFKL